ncbi:MAG: DUF6232 family protein [Gallionella sp.]|nr:DUF6232 family protein [Gallionella sp.]
MKEEQILLDEQGLKVTNARFIAGGQTYAMSGITSVRLIKVPQLKVFAWILIVTGIFFIFIPTIIGIIMLRKQLPPWAVGLSTASGAVNAYFTKDGAFAERVVGALNDAMIARG